MHVIDISRHQQSFSAYAALRRDIEAVIVRLAYGGSMDKSACLWGQQAAAAGLKLGGYGFATWHYDSVCHGNVDIARAAMQQQVRAWIEYARYAGVTWWFAIDQELEKNQEMALDMDHNTQLLAEAAELIRAAGYAPLLYCSVAWDYDHIRTTGLPAYLPYWFAYYPEKIRAKDFQYALLSELPDGKYSRWLKKVYNAGRLAGWQYGSTAWGDWYGCGSANVDRNIFWLEPEKAVAYQTELHSVSTGKMSEGDLQAVLDVLKARSISYEVD